ncbi:histidine phosphatase family protein [Thiohalobacter sp. IOR34]|uniref:histidine phosphatase family protein n=1 Tax=Thiohalobacter sp. IOR34 TaxID=3057176 RepID=UPI0025AF6CFC|nr:histidine phosphatase family protein [Thiohalobacter sp. IOR34]WJW75342.1 histidine phosphatase family protein [Thiohalobacter sp. IOR34]
METRIDFLRHGEPEGGRRFRGHGVDDPLSERGWAQMWAAVGQAADWSSVVSSPLRRCREFAVALAERHGLPLVIEADFREVGFGRWEGLSPEQIMARDAAEYEAFYRDPVHCRPAGAEPLEAFGSRVAAAFERCLQARAGERLLVVAHAGVIRAALGQVLAAAPAAWYRVAVDNAAFTRFSSDGRGCRLVFHNRPGPLSP